MSQNDLIDYENYVRSLIGKESTPCLSHATDHIPLVIKVILETAKDTVEIMTKDLDPAIWADERVINAAIKFLSSKIDTKIVIVSNEELAFQHPFIGALYNQGLRKRLELWQRNLKEEGHPEFVLADRQNYRFESKGSPVPCFCFNDSKVGKVLEMAFSIAKDESSPVRVSTQNVTHRRVVPFKPRS